jgi:hypothetical protein
MISSVQFLRLSASSFSRLLAPVTLLQFLDCSHYDVFTGDILMLLHGLHHSGILLELLCVSLHLLIKFRSDVFNSIVDGFLDHEPE